VMSGVNPQGCQVFSYRHPSATELQHDFLWRTTRDLPERGRIGIFNRSYYEEVLIVRVHPEILRSEGVPDGKLDEKTVWQNRFRSIVGLEKHLHRNGTRIVKFYLPCPKSSSRSGFFSASTSRTRIGSSALPTSRRENSGNAICQLTKSVLVRQALAKRPGMSSPPTIRRTLD